MEENLNYSEVIRMARSQLKTELENDAMLKIMWLLKDIKISENKIICAEKNIAKHRERINRNVDKLSQIEKGNYQVLNNININEKQDGLTINEG